MFLSQTPRSGADMGKRLWDLWSDMCKYLCETASPVVRLSHSFLVTSSIVRLPHLLWGCISVVRLPSSCEAALQLRGYLTIEIWHKKYDVMKYEYIKYDVMKYDIMSRGQMLPGKMSLWQLPSDKDGPSNLPSNSWDIADIEFPLVVVCKAIFMSNPT